MNHMMIYNTKFYDNMSKNGMKCVITKAHYGGMEPRYDILLEDGTKINAVYKKELSENGDGAEWLDDGMIDDQN